MKKAFALFLALILTFGAYSNVFAQTVTRGVGYNVVVNGVSMDFAYGEAINVDGVSMFTAEGYSKFADAEITAEKIADLSPINFEGKNYYSLRDVASQCDLSVFWDSATKTALVVNNDTYARINELLNDYNEKTADMKRCELDINGDIAIFMTTNGEGDALDFPLEASAKIDIEAPFVEMKLKSSVMGTEINLQTYDDGEFQYINSGDGWMKMPSSLAGLPEIIEQVKALEPSGNAAMSDLATAGLRLTESEGTSTIEGMMYVSETFNSPDFVEAMKQVSEMTGTPVNYEWPTEIYVKYVFDANNDLSSCSTKMDMKMNVSEEGQAIELTMGLSMEISKIVFDGDFETTVPESVKSSATDLSLILETAETETTSETATNEVSSDIEESEEAE